MRSSKPTVTIGNSDGSPPLGSQFPMRMILVLTAAFLFAACGDKPADEASSNGGAGVQATLYFSAIPGEGDTKLQEKSSKFAIPVAVGVAGGVPPMGKSGSSVCWVISGTAQ